MTAPRVYLQTQNEHGSWVTLKDRTGSRLEYDLTHDLLRQLKASPVNARLIYVTDGTTATTKQTVRQFRFDRPAPAPRPAPRPVIRLKPYLGRVANWKRTSHISSWYAPIVLR